MPFKIFVVFPLLFVSTVFSAGLYPSPKTYAVSIERYGSHFCGGSVIGRRAIATAAHCIRNASKDKFEIRLGEKKYKISSMYGHKKFDENTHDYDYALLLLNEYLDVMPLELARGDVATGTRMLVSGWLANSDYKKLNVFSVFKYDDEKCFEAYKNTKNVTERMICGQRRQRDVICLGFSGSPVVVNHVLHGIVSWGTKQCTDITVFSRVSVASSWYAKTYAKLALLDQL